MEPVRSKFAKQNAGLDKTPKLFAGIIFFRNKLDFLFVTTWSIFSMLCLPKSTFSVYNSLLANVYHK